MQQPQRQQLHSPNALSISNKFVHLLHSKRQHSFHCDDVHCCASGDDASPTATYAVVAVAAAELKQRPLDHSDWRRSKIGSKALEPHVHDADSNDDDADHSIK